MLIRKITPICCHVKRYFAEALLFVECIFGHTCMFLSIYYRHKTDFFGKSLLIIYRKYLMHVPVLVQEVSRDQ